MATIRTILISSLAMIFFISYLHVKEADANITEAFGPTNCTCSGLSCTCCKDLQVGPINLNQNLCVKFTLKLIPVSVLVLVTNGQTEIANFTIDPKNPPKFCLPLRISQVDVCLQLHDVKLKDLNSFQMCSTLMVHVNTASYRNQTMPCVELNSKSGVVML